MNPARVLRKPKQEQKKGDHHETGKFKPHVEAGKLRLLLAGTKTPLFPAVPTLRELGYPRDFLSGWHAVVAPAGIPDEAKKALIPALEKAVMHPATKGKIEAMGYVVDYRGPDGLRKLVAEDFETAKEIAKKLELNK